MCNKIKKHILYFENASSEEIGDAVILSVACADAL